MGGKENSVEDNNLEEMEEEPHLEDEENLCVVCLSKIKSLTGDGDNDDGYHYYNLLSKNLDVIFLLKNLMQVPDVLLKNNLKDCGNPVDWGMSLCEDCKKLNSEAKLLHVEILKLERKLKLVQQLILDKIRLSPKEESFQLPVLLNDKEKKNIEGKSKKREFWLKTRYFVKNILDQDLFFPQTVAPPVNPFIEGDNLAKSQKKTLTIWVIDKQRKISVDNQDYEDDESKPISCKIERDDNSDHDDNFEDGNPEEDYQIDKDLQDKHKKPYKKCVLSWKCKMTGCSDRFMTEIGLTNHAEKMHGDGEGTDKQFKCGICGKGFWRENEMRRHEPVHKKKKVLKGYGNRKYACHLCEDKFWKKKELMEHLDKKHDETEWRPKRVVELGSCHLCGVTFKEEGELTMHLMTDHKDEEAIRRVEGISKYWRCQVRGCNDKYAGKEGLDKHWERMHKGVGGGGKEVEKKWKCGICGKGFWNRTKMRKHEEIHRRDGRKDFKCEKCMKMFGNKEYLRGHMYRHRKMEEAGGILGKAGK